ncbi:MAG TPA: hypothetical protein VFG49_04640 [Dyella sp.]|nr:hypothetical protein [Dyella sp.]HET6552806.1 hypothetical protein [Dyella sp.]
MHDLPAIYLFTRAWAAIFIVVLMFVAVQYRLRTSDIRHAFTLLD